MAGWVKREERRGEERRGEERRGEERRGEERRGTEHRNTHKNTLYNGSAGAGGHHAAPKKGDWRVCSNYRGITLLSLPGKVYSAVLERRVRRIVEPRIQEEQCGFRPGCGTLDQLYTLSRVLEGAWEFAQPVHMCFVDLEKAFDRVPRGSLVRIAGSKSNSFPVRVGLCQGCPLSLILFIIFMDRISRCSHGVEGIRFGDLRIGSLLFADDVVLLASSVRDLQLSLDRFAAAFEAAGMKISTSKSEDRCRVRITADAAPVRSGEERAEPKGEALNLLVDLRSYPHL
ncbi:R2 Retrovirus-related Pol polyprotein from type I retrotransposable element [Takifugu flavidus]|uniref:R2 Retrovirus-related Pol polyprotein from type I retrotransposable element n=1 Tax=Takifugu flavidus TaxID=433684 RepID=A0A5C6PTQ2_9TELE|nr:R2 Retrovirus-related Pol polyprotein from type I retrotransposable element [Takifugu flavidus]